MRPPRASLYLDRRTELAGGGYRLTIKISRYRKSPQYIPLQDHAYTPEEYDMIMNSSRPSKRHHDARMRIRKIEQRAIESLEELRGAYSRAAFEKRLFGIDPQDSSLKAAFERYIQSRKEMSKPLSPSSVWVYNSSRLCFELFAGRKMHLEDVSPSFMRRWQKWAEDKHMSRTSLGIYADRMRAVFKYEIAEGRISNEMNPFGQAQHHYQPPKVAKRKTKMALSILVVQRIIDYTPSVGRDFWLLSYLMNGMNMADILRIKEEHFISRDELRYVRKKTRSTSVEQRIISVALLPMTWEIINRWSIRKLDQQAYVFSTLDGIDKLPPEKRAVEETKRVRSFTAVVNRSLAKMSQDMGLPKITTYSARHSFAKNLKRAGVSTELIQEMLDHSSIETTEIYTSSIVYDESIEAQMQITRKLLPGS